MLPSRWISAVLGVVVVAVVPSPGHAQLTGPGLVVPSPAAAGVSVRRDSFVASSGARRPLGVYRAAGSTGKLPVVVFANGTNADFNTWRAYTDWARLVTSREMTAVLYQGPGFDPQLSREESQRASAADLDSVLATLARRSSVLGTDAANVVIWAGSGQTWTGTPVALTGNRPGIRGYVLYYGGGDAQAPRVDVPVLVVRAGLDAPRLNQGLDSLTMALVQAGVPLTLVNHHSGPHAFDIMDSTVATARIIEVTLDFMRHATDVTYQAMLAASEPAARAAAAFAAGRWKEAEELYAALARVKPNDRNAIWRLGLAQLEAGRPREALASFGRARELGQGGARDLGLPAARAAVRTADSTRAVEWINWSLESFPRIRGEIASDTELAPLLTNAAVKQP